MQINLIIMPGIKHYSVIIFVLSYQRGKEKLTNMLGGPKLYQASLALRQTTGLLNQGCMFKHYGEIKNSSDVPDLYLRGILTFFF